VASSGPMAARVGTGQHGLLPPVVAADHPPSVFPEVTGLGESGTSAPWPRRIIDRSERIAQAEEDLRCACSVLVVGDPITVSVDGLAAELAHHHDLLAGSITVRRVQPSELLLVCSNEDAVVRVLNSGWPIQLPLATLHCRRWSRLQNACGVILPQLIDLELRGIPTHVWELDTTDHLLDEWCWIRSLHSNTVNQRDYSTFRLSAWCSNPGEIPFAMELVVVEPPAPVEEDPPLKRALS
jgi:hypothetical protein